ncbi:hypothetical protein F5141DRAFT_1247472 [Pisolithus sp. B1]|nr:hypothetical protein F5141DRAFT_1247472 [Pisolithus sp. B1]
MSVPQSAPKHPAAHAEHWATNRTSGLNVSYDRVDRRGFKHPDKNYFAKSIANVLKKLGIKKGDTVSIYLPMTWQSVTAILACSRIGAVHSVVLQALARNHSVVEFSIVDLGSSRRQVDLKCRSQNVPTKNTSSFSSIPAIKCRKRRDETIGGTERRQRYPTTAQLRFCRPKILFSFSTTSGSTGKQKGAVLTTGGYLLGAAMTVKDVRPIHVTRDQPSIRRHVNIMVVAISLINSSHHNRTVYGKVFSNLDGISIQCIGDPSTHTRSTNVVPETKLEY